MPDIIRLLPDSVANQIAAGEVIQRPASAIKELLENAIDAGADIIRVVAKGAGKTLLQVIDNGCGMSPTDARMSFERHATSKINNAKDLFSIRTFGFRGEALASIAAISQVEMKTKKESDEVGTLLLIEGSKVKLQEEIACSAGTSIAVKNLFYNVPARRNFLKSDAVEFRHIIEEFQRVALIHPDIELSLHHNEKLVFQLNKSNLKQRIVNIFGSPINEKLVPVELVTEHVTISGFIGKPETARKTKGEQYFFANGRYIRHPYLNHAVEQAYQELIPDSAYPTYFLGLVVDPGSIDVNIHPTKTEVNFQYGQLVYAALRSAVKHSLGMFSIAPTLDFETEPSFDIRIPANYQPKPPTIKVNPEYNPFNTQRPAGGHTGMSANREGWEKLYEINKTPVKPDDNVPVPSGENGNQQPVTRLFDENREPGEATTKLLQVHNRYIVAVIRSGVMIIDQQKAIERIEYERLTSSLSTGSGEKQRCLFSQTIHLSPGDASVFEEMLPDLDRFGFEISSLGDGAFVLNSTPAATKSIQPEGFIESLIENFKNNKPLMAMAKQPAVATLVARNIAQKFNKSLKQPEMQSIVDELFACQSPEIAFDGSRIIKIIPVQEIEKFFQ
jgi:DNA mismatch repair protein MutL